MAEATWNLPRISRLLSEARGKRIQDLPSPEAFTEIQDYVGGLEDRLEHEQSPSVRRAIREELAKIDSMLPEIKERRTRKIVREATNQALGIPAETQALTPAETAAFDKLSDSIRTFHDEIHSALDDDSRRHGHVQHAGPATPVPVSPGLPTQAPSRSEALKTPTAPPSVQVTPLTGAPATPPEPPAVVDSDAWVIRIIEEPPVVAGLDGPWELKVGDVARLPEKLAKILVEQGKARRIPQ